MKALARACVLLFALLSVTGLAFGSSPAPTEESPPNILVILVDDLGIDQLHLYDDENYYSRTYPYAHTPNIDILAGNGVLFTQARAAPVCSPTRAILNCGKYSFENGVGCGIAGANQAGISCPSDFRDFQPSTSSSIPLADA